MSKNNKLLLSIIGGFLVFCCGLTGLASLLPSSDAATPTAVALVGEVEQSQSPAEEQAGEPGASALPAQPSAAPATVDIEPTDVPTLQPTAPPEPTATATNTPQPTNTAAPTATNTSTPTATNTSAPSPTATVANTPTPGIIDPLGNPILGDLARVTQIVDGDTIDVDINGQVYRVRYIGMNTPERGRPFFQEATDANANLVSGQMVILVKDVSETDRFGRLLRYVYLQDGTFVNAELVRLGYAMASAYPPDVAMQHIFTELQRTAVESGAGLWSSQAAATAVPTIRATSPPQPTTPPQPQPTAPPAPSGGVTIVGVNKRDEYVDIRNQSGSDVDLAGWVLVSEKGNQRCTLGGVITVGQTLRIWALASDAGQGGFNCGFGSPIWNNSESDPAVLYNAAGQEVSRW